MSVQSICVITDDELLLVRLIEMQANFMFPGWEIVSGCPTNPDT